MSYRDDLVALAGELPPETRNRLHRSILSMRQVLDDADQRVADSIAAQEAVNDPTSRVVAFPQRPLLNVVLFEGVRR